MFWHDVYPARKRVSFLVGNVHSESKIQKKIVAENFWVNKERIQSKNTNLDKILDAIRNGLRPVLLYTGIPRSRNWISVFEGNPIGFPPSPIGMAGNFKSLLFS